MPRCAVPLGCSALQRCVASCGAMLCHALEHQDTVFPFRGAGWELWDLGDESSACRLCTGDEAWGLVVAHVPRAVSRP